MAKKDNVVSTMREIKLKVKEEVLLNLLVSALNGGSTYWARCIDVAPVKQPFGAIIEDIEADESEQIQVDIDTMLLGLQRLADRAVLERTEKDWHLKPSGAARHLAAALTGDGDSSTADVVLQMGALGEVLYG